MGDILDLPMDVQRVGSMAASGGQLLNEAERRFLQRRETWFYQLEDGPRRDERRARRDWLPQLAFKHRLIPAPFADEQGVRSLLVRLEPSLFPRRGAATRGVLGVRDYPEAISILGGPEDLAMWTVVAGRDVVPVICAEEVVWRLEGKEIGLAGQIRAVSGAEGKVVRNQWVVEMDLGRADCD